ncbi:MAG: phage terminase large subunit [Acidobacteriota bacterium]|jgi:phage terminase large subunit
MSLAGQYKTTTAFEKICQLKKEVRIIQGGKGSSKTVSILMLFILLAISKRQNLILSVVAQSLPNLKSGAIRDFEKILKSWGLYDKFHVNKSDHTYTFGSNVIEFFSVDGEGSRLGSRRTHLYINEADFIKFSTYIELYSRTSEFTILDYNPRRRFWVHKELIGEPHVDYLVLNFTHNEFIPVKEKASILWFKKKADEGSKYFQNKWRVLGLGLLGITEGIIFENWKEAKQVPSGARYLGAALDWGFSGDPTGIVKIYKFDNKIYLKESLYKKGLLNSQIAAHIKQDKELIDGIIIADASEPKSIAELRTYGVKIKKSDVKDIDFGISVMQEFELVLIGKNLIDEFENYSYKFNKAGEQLGVPVDDWNHLIDPSRYFFAEVLSKSSTTGGDLKFVK